MSIRAAVLPLAACLALAAQDHPGGNRFGLGLSLMQPLDSLGDNLGSGFQAGLQVHFNRESRHLGRLRIDYLQADSRGLVQDGLTTSWNGSTWVLVPNLARTRMEAYSVAYEWMPHLEPHSRSGAFGILGMGGMLWNESLHATSTPRGTYTESDLGFTLSAGAGFRFNPHATLEARLVRSELQFGGRHRYGTVRTFLTLGTSLRF